MSKKRIDQLFLENYNRFLNYIELRQRNDSEDILQEVYCKLIEGVDLLAPVENLVAYIFRAIRNKIIDFKRKRKPFEEYHEELPDDTSDSAFEDYEQKEILTIIEDALLKLPPCATRHLYHNGT